MRLPLRQPRSPLRQPRPPPRSASVVRHINAQLSSAPPWRALLLLCSGTLGERSDEDELGAALLRDALREARPRAPLSLVGAETQEILRDTRALRDSAAAALNPSANSVTSAMSAVSGAIIAQGRNSAFRFSGSAVRPAW